MTDGPRQIAGAIGLDLLDPTAERAVARLLDNPLSCRPVGKGEFEARSWSLGGENPERGTHGAQEQEAASGTARLAEEGADFIDSRADGGHEFYPWSPPLFFQEEIVSAGFGRLETGGFWRHNDNSRRLWTVAEMLAHANVGCRNLIRAMRDYIWPPVPDIRFRRLVRPRGQSMR